MVSEIDMELFALLLRKLDCGLDSVRKLYIQRYISIKSCETLKYIIRHRVFHA